ncbi:hypothetical protein Acor_31040 [Acrocarpospora corrugata]|uniref:Peptidase S8/S53 domain-containing protein n=1 Tax=Acrocarpospora corrugata TaxID=35763 RepID=A0A5M3VYM3_9ACTN|nr:S8 family peptidase [Acrocarpospora corrugata]GES01040.1 hypothetical protein Acor_31040 [Acrocarpospora corrugata]
MGEPTPPGRRHLPHLIVPGSGIDAGYKGRQARGGGGLREILDKVGHSAKLTADLEHSDDAARAALAELPENLRGDGFVVTVTCWSPGHHLALERLDARGAKLLSVQPETEEQPERALVWMPFPAVADFLRLFEQFATEHTSSGKPKNAALVANIEELRLSMLQELWQENEPFPDPSETRWWEIWLVKLNKGHEPVSELRQVAEEFRWPIADAALAFPYRDVTLIRASAEELGILLTTNAIPGELRNPSSTEEFFTVDRQFQVDLVQDLEDRIAVADPQAPAVCVLDCGVLASHPLLQASFDGTHTVIPGTTSAPVQGATHGTEMAGLALLGDLDQHLVSSHPVRLEHRLESVKILRGQHDDQNDPRLYGKVIADATSRVEIEQIRPRVYSMAVTSGDVKGSDGRPTSWSSAIDALAIGTEIAPSATGITLLGMPDPSASRLFFISAGNVTNVDWHADHLAVSDSRQIRDPAQAWNALAVGAYTDRADPPVAPMFAGYRVMAPEGELSPFSRTSVPWGKGRPIKPDIVMEGGNLLISPSGTFDQHDAVQVATTSGYPGRLVTTANATSAATSQAARLGALVLSRYPTLSPEAVRGLLVHSAEWTPTMRAHFPSPRAQSAKPRRHALLKRYGWGVPTERRVLTSAASNVTLIIQDEFQPFALSGSGISMRAMRLHELPWPSDQLQGLMHEQVRMRVTLSYFIEPNPSNRGWQGRYAYPSHGLRFDVIRPTESRADFQRRLSNEAEGEERGVRPSSTVDDRWEFGTQRRSSGSLHADIWTGDGAALARCGVIAVYPVGGWWKQNNRRDRVDLPVRYALLISLLAYSPTDIYTPIAIKIGVPVAIEI